MKLPLIFAALVALALADGGGGGKSRGDGKNGGDRKNGGGGKDEQQDGKPFCATCVQCYQELANLIDDCQKQTTKPSNGTSACWKEADDKYQVLKKKDRDYFQTWADCVKERNGEALPVSKKQAARCQGPPERGHKRGKRQDPVRIISDAGTLVGDTVTGVLGGSDPSGGTGGSGSGSGTGSSDASPENKDRKRRKRQREVEESGDLGGIIGDVLDPPPVEEEDDDEGDDQQHGQECVKKVYEKLWQCRQQARCCSEARYCVAKAELTDLHHQVYQTKAELADKRRQCIKEKQAQQPQQGGGNQG